MEPNNTYKTLSIVLGIIALVFAVLYFTKPSEPITETLNDISDEFGECRAKIAAWQNVNGGLPTISAQARTELNSILESCKSSTEASQEKI